MRFVASAPDISSVGRQTKELAFDEHFYEECSKCAASMS
jgi:hypothetical protein